MHDVIDKFFDEIKLQGLNLKNIEDEEIEKIIDKDLKEFLGHTPLEVFFGCLLGIAVAVLFRGYILS